MKLFSDDLALLLNHASYIYYLAYKSVFTPFEIEKTARFTSKRETEECCYCSSTALSMEVATD